jgi:hypothetical protein
MSLNQVAQIPKNSLFTKPVNLLLETSPEQKLPKFFGFPATCRQSQATGQRRFDNFTLPQQISAAPEPFGTVCRSDAVLVCRPRNGIHVTIF